MFMKLWDNNNLFRRGLILLVAIVIATALTACSKQVIVDEQGRPTQQTLPTTRADGSPLANWEYIGGMTYVQYDKVNNVLCYKNPGMSYGAFSCVAKPKD